MKDLKMLLRNRTVQMILLCAGALLLLILVWQVFFAGDRNGEAQSGTDAEIKMAELLAKLEDVDSAYVAISEEDGVPVGAIVFFQGNDGIHVRIQILDLTSTALRIDKKNIQVYPAS